MPSICKAKGEFSRMNSKASQPVDQHVGARIRALRIMRGLSQEKLADRSGITFQQVQKYEKGTNRVSPSRLVEFAETLQVDPSYFFEGAPALESTTDDPLSETIRGFASSREGIQLASAFLRLTPAQRRALLPLVEEIASAEERS